VRPQQVGSRVRGIRIQKELKGLMMSYRSFPPIGPDGVILTNGVSTAAVPRPMERLQTDRQVLLRCYECPDGQTRCYRSFRAVGP
jgi:hypothetical protein